MEEENDSVNEKKMSVLEPHEEGMDLVTVLQARLGDMSFLLTNSFGTLQRDAPHIDEHSTKQIDGSGNTINDVAKEFAGNIVRASRGFKNVLDKLKEEMKSEEELEEEISMLSEQNDIEDEKLFQEVKKVKEMLNKVSSDLSEMVSKK